MGTWPLAPAGPCPEELGVGRDYLGPNTSLASDGHFWANQASKDPTTATSPVPFIPLDHGFQDSVSRWPRGRTGIPSSPRVGMGRAAPALHRDNTPPAWRRGGVPQRMTRDPRRMVGETWTPRSHSFLPLRFWETVACYVLTHRGL